jgi:apolipoprotein N-acyltransferase
MERLAHRILLLWGWQRMLVAALAGALGALALAPVYVWPALIVSLTVAVWLLDGSVVDRRAASLPTLRSAAVIGWWFGFGYHIAGLWWLGAAFIVESEEFLWALPLGVLGLPAALALFHALGFALAAVLWSSNPVRILALSVGLTVAELLRGHVLTGFPWNLYGQVFGVTDVSAQGAALVGVYGLTFLAIAIAAAPASIATGKTALSRFAPAVLALVVLSGLLAYGIRRLPDGPSDTVAGVKIRMMQPNVSQREKNRPRGGQEVLSRYLALSDRSTGPTSSGIADVTHLIWPESAFPFLLSREPQALSQIAALLKPGRTTLITGAVRAEDGGAGREDRYFNSIHVVLPDGVIGDSYDKVHLVPFGEYLPFQTLLQRLGLRQFVNAPGGFEAGASRKALSIPGLPPAAPLICYEAIFPASVASAPRPGFLLNVTNDAWFGMTTGPHQHFAQARMRAVEQGLPLIRAANTGISAVFDAYGRTLQSLPLGAEGVIDTALPVNHNSTLYSRWHSIPLVVALLMSTTLASLFRRA